jgi:hypothetical protein
MAAFHTTRNRAFLILAFAGVGISIVAWAVCKNPAINFLPGDRRAEWIVFPTAVDSRGHGFASVDATFRREFVLNNQPATARLSVRAMRRAEIKVNGSSVGFRSPQNWKENTTIDVSNQLHAGGNIIEARVFNQNGPPALWLNLIADQLTLRSDEIGKPRLRDPSGIKLHWHLQRRFPVAETPSRAAQARLMR